MDVNSLDIDTLSNCKNNTQVSPKNANQLQKTSVSSLFSLVFKREICICKEDRKQESDKKLT